MCEQHCGRPSHVYNTGRPTKLTALETISRWLMLKSEKNRFLSHPLGHLGVTYALHLWLVGKPVVDFRPIFVVIELFSLSHTAETLWAEIGRSRRFSKGGGSLWTQISEGRGRRPQTTLGISDCPFVRYKNICSASFSFVTIHACDRQTDRRTDRQNYDSQDRPRICSRGKNWEKKFKNVKITHKRFYHATQ